MEGRGAKTRVPQRSLPSVLRNYYLDKGAYATRQHDTVADNMIFQNCRPKIGSPLVAQLQHRNFIVKQLANTSTVKLSNARAAKCPAGPLLLWQQLQIATALSSSSPLISRSRTLRALVLPEATGGNGSGGGDKGSNGGNGGSDDASSSGEGGGGGNRLFQFVVFAGVCYLASRLAIALSEEHKKRVAAAEADKAASSASTVDPEEITAVKRLLRDAFSDLIKVRERLNSLESFTGVDQADGDAPGAELIPRMGARSGGAGQRGAVGGVLRVGAGMLWAQDDAAMGATEAATGALRGLGINLGTELLLRIGGLVRGAADAVAVDLSLDPTDDSFTMRRLIYNCKPFPGLRLVAAPFGARGRDAAYTLNPFAGQGLTSAVRHGSPLHRDVLGSLMGATLDLGRLWINGGLFSKGKEI
jgi:hypothetical protein